MNKWIPVVAIALAPLCLAPSARSQTASGTRIGPNDGRVLYMTHCASCHGTSARGDGPVADSLRRRPSDLTQLAKANGGAFPSAKAQRIIDGREVGAHGSVEMPVWGDAFRRTLAGDTAAIAARIAALVRYLESIQERAGH